MKDGVWDTEGAKTFFTKNQSGDWVDVVKDAFDVCSEKVSGKFLMNIKL